MREAMIYENSQVTPRAGVWIEIVINLKGGCAKTVTPRAGVWIEI